MRQTSPERDPSALPYDIPLFHISLKNITYAPFVKQVSSQGASWSFKTFLQKCRSYRASSTKKRKIVLENITTNITPSSLTAWMGPSGSGKTSLISVVAGFCSSDEITKGEILINDRKVDKATFSSYRKNFAVVWQDDLLLQNLSVEETIYFAAALKVQRFAGSSKIEHDQLVKSRLEEVIADLGLESVRHSLIGSSMAKRGISGGERKRVAIAVELVTRPSVLLLDEPTSGLDATTALALTRLLKKLASAHGQAIVMVVHQPRSTIFNLFDSLLLLSLGNMVYNGKPSQAKQYLESYPHLMVEDEASNNSDDVDWIMDMLHYDENNRRQLASHWQKYSSTTGNEQLSVETTSQLLDAFRSSVESTMDKGYGSSFWTQLRLLSSRSMKQQRGEKITRVALIVTLAYTSFVSIFWFQMPDETSTIYERNSLMFFIIIAQSNSIVTASVTTFQRERNLLNRERSKKMYSMLAYFIAKTLADMVNTVVLPTIYGASCYWITNLRPTGEAFLIFMLIFYLTLLTAQSMGLLLSISIPNVEVSLLLAPLLTIFVFIMGGFYIPFVNIAPWLQWATYLSLCRYAYSGLLINEYQGRMIPCTVDGTPQVAFGDSTSCPLPGETVLDSLGMSELDIWANIALLLLMQVIFRVLAYFVLRFKK